MEQVKTELGKQISELETGIRFAKEEIRDLEGQLSYLQNEYAAAKAKLKGWWQGQGGR